MNKYLTPEEAYSKKKTQKRIFGVCSIIAIAVIVACLTYLIGS